MHFRPPLHRQGTKRPPISPSAASPAVDAAAGAVDVVAGVARAAAWEFQTRVTPAARRRHGRSRDRRPQPARATADDPRRQCLSRACLSRARRSRTSSPRYPPQHRAPPSRRGRSSSGHPGPPKRLPEEIAAPTSKSDVVLIPGGAHLAAQMCEQRARGAFDEIEHFLEAVRAPVVGVRHFGCLQIGSEF